MTTPLYIPPGCTTLDKVEGDKIKLGIQGPPFSGKTTAALTFPNPIVASFDRKVMAHKHRSDVVNIPFYDGFFCDKIFPRTGLVNPPNRRDALLKWLVNEGPKLSPLQTLILDNSTGIEEAFHQQYWLEPVVTKGGEIDSFAEWNQKAEFFRDLHQAMNGVPANIVYICHESPDRDKKGDLNGKIRPLLTGQAGDKLAGNFPDYFRAITINRPHTEEQKKKCSDACLVDRTTLDEWIASCLPTQETIYLWLTQSSEDCDCGSTTLINCPKYVLASYSSFEKYRRKKTI